MWAEVPWAGHYVINSPIWVTAHYTQATKPGWSYLPVGQGSGMLPDGGSYVGLVSPGVCGGQAASDTDYTMIVQTMAYDNSKCFKVRVVSPPPRVHCLGRMAMSTQPVHTMLPASGTSPAPPHRVP